jgi:hypothetical protein
MNSGNHTIYLAAAGGKSSDARATTRSAYARLAMASTLDLHGGLLDVWRRAADKPASDTLTLPDRFLRTVARVAKRGFTFSVNVVLHLEQGCTAREQGCTAREQAELRYCIAPLRSF